MASFRYSNWIGTEIRIRIGSENIAGEMFNAVTLSISVNLTFNFGAYDVTTFTRSVVFQCKSKIVAKKWVPTRTYNNSSQQISGYLWIRNEMHCQGMQFGKQEWNS